MLHELLQKQRGVVALQFRFWTTELLRRLRDHAADFKSLWIKVSGFWWLVRQLGSTPKIRAGSVCTVRNCALRK